MTTQIKFKVKNWKHKYSFDNKGYCDEEDLKCDSCKKTKYHLDEFIYLGFKLGFCEKCYKRLKRGNTN